MDTVLIIIGTVNAVLLIIILVKLFFGGKQEIDTGSIISSVKDGLNASQRELREEMSGSVQNSVKTMGESITEMQRTISAHQADRLAQTEQHLKQLQNDVSGKLDGIRQVVDERLQNTLDEKMTRFGTTLRETQQQSGDAQKSQLDTMDKKLSDSLDAMRKSVTGQQEQFGDSMQEKMLMLEKRFQSLEASVKETVQGMSKILTELMTQAGQAQKSQIETMDGKLQDTLNVMSGAIADRQTQSGKEMQDRLVTLEKRFQTLESSNNERLESMKRTMSEHLDRLSETNQKKLDSIQSMVSDKLESNLRESFRVVSERLEQVHKSLGEMQTIATGVGDLKKVLSNVKTRGIMGEIQLGMILGEILAPDQYEQEIATIPGSSNHVEFAVRLPGADGEGVVYLPIDSKFPGDTFSSLQDAYESGDTVRIAEAKKQLAIVIKKCAADIHQKYVEPPYTTNFGIMFLPFEGLYAEVVNSGLVEVLQRDYGVTITGPSTMAAMLNSLQMGFRTLAIQKRSNEVWKILGEAKGEFEKFEKALKATQDKIAKAGEDLELLVGRRTRAINRKLRGVEALDYSDTPLLTDSAFYDDGEDAD